MNTTTNTRGVSEAMVAELIAAGDFLAMNGTDGMVRRWEKAKAALSATEPAAQGDKTMRQIMDGNAWRAALIGLCVATQEADVSTPEKAAANVRARLTRLTAPPAQPDGLVPEGVERDAARYRFIRDAQATIIYKRKCHGVWEPLVDTRETSTRCASLDEAIDRAMLAASPAAHAALSGEVRELVEVVQALERACDEALIVNTYYEDEVGALSAAAKSALDKLRHKERT